MRWTPRAWLACGLLLALWPVSGAQADGKRQVDDLLARSRSLMVGGAPVFQAGAWSAYRLRLHDRERDGDLASLDALLRISFPIHVDHERPLPEGGFWMEFEFGDPNAGEGGVHFMVLKMLVVGDPREAGAVKGVFIGAGGRRPWELGEKWLRRGQEAPAEACQQGDAGGCAKAGGKVREFPAKKIYTKVGWLEARRVLIDLPDGSSQQMWLSRAVPVLGFVRANLAKAMDLELEGFGSGALSRLDETQAVPLPDPEELDKELKDLERR